MHFIGDKVNFYFLRWKKKGDKDRKRRRFMKIIAIMHNKFFFPFVRSFFPISFHTVRLPKKKYYNKKNFFFLKRNFFLIFFIFQIWNFFSRINSSKIVHSLDAYMIIIEHYGRKKFIHLLLLFFESNLIENDVEKKIFFFFFFFSL